MNVRSFAELDDILIDDSNTLDESPSMLKVDEYDDDFEDNNEDDDIVDNKKGNDIIIDNEEIDEAEREEQILNKYYQQQELDANESNTSTPSKAYVPDIEEDKTAAEVTATTTTAATTATTTTAATTATTTASAAAVSSSVVEFSEKKDWKVAKDSPSKFVHITPKIIPQGPTILPLPTHYSSQRLSKVKVVSPNEVSKLKGNHAQQQPSQVEQIQIPSVAAAPQLHDVYSWIESIVEEVTKRKTDTPVSRKAAIADITATAIPIRRGMRLNPTESSVSHSRKANIVATKTINTTSKDDDEDSQHEDSDDEDDDSIVSSKMKQEIKDKAKSMYISKFTVTKTPAAVTPSAVTLPSKMNDNIEDSLLEKLNIDKVKLQSLAEHIYAECLSDIVGMCKQRSANSSSTEEMVMRRVMAQHIAKCFTPASIVKSVRHDMLQSAIDVAIKYNT